MPDITFSIPARVHFGADAVLQIGAEAARLASRVLLVTEAILYEGGTIDRVSELLARRGLDPVVYDEVIPGATTSTAEEGARLARGARADLVVGLGGVKTLSLARLIAAAAPSAAGIEEILDRGCPDKPPIRCIAVPTSCRDPFLFGGSWLVTDARDRSPVIGRSELDCVAAAFLDPKLSLTLPARYVACAAFDCLLHAVEGYLAAGASFLSDTLFLKAVEILGPVLRQGPADDLLSRTEVAKAGLLASMGLVMGRSGVGVALAYALNARLRVPKAFAATVLLPHALEFSLAMAAERLQEIGRRLGEDLSGLTASDAAAHTVEALRGMIGASGLPARLRDLGVNLEDMPEVAEAAHRLELMNRVPRIASADDLYELLKAAY